MAEKKESKKPEAVMMLRNIRCSFPDVMKRALYNGEEKSYGITLLFFEDDPHDQEQLKKFKALMSQVFKASTLKKPPAENCLMKNSEKDEPRDEYGPETYVLRANSKNRPLVFTEDGREVVDIDDNPIYSGCRVNARVAAWAQNDTRNKRINATIHGVQFAGDGESFDGSHVNRSAVFEDFGAKDDGGFGEKDDIDFDGDREADFDDDIPF